MLSRQMSERPLLTSDAFTEMVATPSSWSVKNAPMGVQGALAK